MQWGTGEGKGLRKGNLSVKASGDDIVATGSSLTEIMKDVNFWLLSFMVMCGTGAGLTFINNLGQQVKALAGALEIKDAKRRNNTTIQQYNCHNGTTMQRILALDASMLITDVLCAHASG